MCNGSLQQSCNGWSLRPTTEAVLGSIPGVAGCIHSLDWNSGMDILEWNSGMTTDPPKITMNDYQKY